MRAKQDGWLPSDMSPSGSEDNNVSFLAELRDRARGLADATRVALTINILTEEGLPHFHRLIAEHLGSRNFWSKWNNLWTAEEDRHGNILRDYIRDSRLLNFSALERCNSTISGRGSRPDWAERPVQTLHLYQLPGKGNAGFPHQYGEDGGGTRTAACLHYAENRSG